MSCWCLRTHSERPAALAYKAILFPHARLNAIYPRRARMAFCVHTHTHTHTHAKTRTRTCAKARADSKGTGTLLLHVLTEHARNKRSQKNYGKKNVKGLLRIKTSGSRNTSDTIHLVNSIRSAPPFHNLFKPPAVTLH